MPLLLLLLHLLLVPHPCLLNRPQASPGSPYRPEQVDAALFAHLRSERLSALALRILTVVRGGAAPAAGAASEAEPVDVNAIRTYGQLFEGLLRSWRLMPIGLYRRVHPATGLKTSAQTVAALQVRSKGWCMLKCC